MTQRTMMVVLLAVLVCTTLHAQQWERIANPIGGSFGPYTVAVLNDWTFVAASKSSAAIWRTRTPEQMGSLEQIIVTVNGIRSSVSDIVEHRGVLYARRGNGFITSTDEGMTWNSVGAQWPIDCSQSPSTQMMDLHATQEALYAWCELSGPWRSTDGGVTWKDLRPIAQGRVPTRDAAYGAALVAVLDGPEYDPALHVSTNDGATWTTRSKPPMPEGVQLRFQHVSIGHGDVLYVLVIVTGQTPAMRTYRSADAGATWSEVTGLSGLSARVYAVKDVVLSDATIMRSEDQGLTWAPFTNGFGSSGVLSLSPSWSHVFASTQDLIYRVPIGQVTSVDESVDGSRFAVHDEQYMRGGVPYTTLHVDRDVTVDMFNVLGERVGSYRLEAGEHHLDTPMPTLLIMKPLRP